MKTEYRILTWDITRYECCLIIVLLLFIGLSSFQATVSQSKTWDSHIFHNSPIFPSQAATYSTLLATLNLILNSSIGNFCPIFACLMLTEWVLTHTWLEHKFLTRFSVAFYIRSLISLEISDFVILWYALSDVKIMQ